MDGDRRSRIAVVNSDPQFLELVSELLEEVGPYQAFTFRDTETSLAELRATAPDVVIIDILVDALPSGWELALVAGADQTLGPVPIIVTTPDMPGVQHRVAELRQIANVRVLPKPFKLDDLRANVRDALLVSPRARSGSIETT